MASNAIRKAREVKRRRRYRATLRRAEKGDQLGLDLRPTFTWGGARERAGRPVIRAPGKVPHRQREKFRPTEPLHLSLRLEEGAIDLCSEPWFDAFLWALRLEREREGVRYVVYSAQGNHLHFIVEALDLESLATSIKGFKTRLTALASAILGRRVQLFVPGYHFSVLRSPRQVRHALAYIVENAAKHAAAAGRLDPRSLRDPFTSLGLLELQAHRGWAQRAVGPLATVAPVSWLLRSGWQLL